ncbi:MAG TPA: ABC transporter substrate-binding protein [Solirubrobacterales bacterium]|nr:ABC transporter substrate-binding protein [Solirubrobacterales bacterium]
MALDGYYGPENVGILMAEERGYFTDVGIDAIVTAPSPPSRPVSYVMSGIVDLAVSHQPQVAIARGKDLPVVAVGSLISRPTAAMIWLQRSRIGGIADLRGKTIAIPGLPFQEEFLASILARAGLTLADVEVRVAGYDLLPDLVKGRADAIFGGSWNLEGAVLEARGLDPVITRVQSLGVPSYDELVVIARSNRVSKDPQLIRDFMSAVARGTADALEDPEAAARVVVDGYEANPDLSRKSVEAEIEATLPLLSRSGYMDPAQAEGLVDWMQAEGMIRKKPPVSSLLTNEYLAHSGQ